MRCEEASWDCFCGVAFKPVDLAAFLVLRALDARLLGRAELAVFRGVRFHAFDAGLAPFRAAMLRGCSATRFQPLLDSPLLVHVAAAPPSRLLRRSCGRKQNGDCDCDERGCCFMIASLKFFLERLPEQVTPVWGHGLPGNGKKCNNSYSGASGPAPAGLESNPTLGRLHGSDANACARHRRLSRHPLRLEHSASFGPVAMLGENIYLGL